MAYVVQRGQRWQVRWSEVGGRRRARQFGSEAEAQLFADGVPRQRPKPDPTKKPRAPRTPGRPRGKARRTRSQIIDLLAANFEVDDNGCWLWTGLLTNVGYARLTWKHEGRRVRGGHRVMLHAIGQRVPTELVVDHLCRVRHCVNPDHLDMVVTRENLLRSPIAPAALNAAKTHCPRGHEYSPENTMTTLPRKGRGSTGRACRACLHDRNRNRPIRDKKGTAA